MFQDRININWQELEYDEVGCKDMSLRIFINMGTSPLFSKATLAGPKGITPYNQESQ